MADADRLAARAGVPVPDLMEAAGRAVARAVLEGFGEARRLLCLCGAGNNGGDGYVAARELSGRLAVTVLEVRSEPSTPEARSAREALVAQGLTPAALTREAVRSWLEGADPGSTVVVDALLGSGLTRPLEGEVAAVVAEVNAADVPVLAVDVPTGVVAGRAVPPGDHVRADVTVQLAGAKVASAFHPARAAFSGARPGRPATVLVADIGVPEDVLESVSPTLYLDSETVVDWLPRRAPDAHKYDAGTVAVAAGSARYLGAGELVARGAWRAGAGLVTLVTPERHPAAWPETILVPSRPGDAWPPPGLGEKAADALVAGPGMDRDSLPKLGDMLAWAPGRVVLDAGALELDSITRHVEVLRELRRGGRPAVLTPHGGEAARLLTGLGSEHDVASDPLGAARALSSATDAVVVLKGAATVIAAPDGREAVSDRGHPGMASGGTGDVLAGVIGALLAAPGGDVFERACAGVYLHGLAGERAAAVSGVGLVASDVADALPSALAEMRS